ILTKLILLKSYCRALAQVYIAFDGWTSLNRHFFFSVNAFFPDEDTFRPRKVLLGLPTIPLAHTGENVSAVAMEALQK
ncbi:hypothetical protein FOC4_g10000692, partial [Fusarium odoratissimum]